MAARTELSITRSSVDETRFGMRTARVVGVSVENLSDVLASCRKDDIRFLIARVPTTDVHAAQAMEQQDFLLMDTLVYYARSLTKIPIPEDTGQVPIRPVRVGEHEAVRAVATESFRGYFGHYHADSRLDPTLCDEGYTEWAVRSCLSRDVADEVLIADLSGSIVGFATLRLNSPVEGEGVLFGVHPSAQGKGIYRSFMVRAMEWLATRGAERMIVSTQVTNLGVQKVWIRVGFEPSYSYYTFHKWFDPHDEYRDARWL